MLLSGQVTVVVLHTFRGVAFLPEAKADGKFGWNLRLIPVGKLMPYFVEVRNPDKHFRACKHPGNVVHFVRNSVVGFQDVGHALNQEFDSPQRELAEFQMLPVGSGPVGQAITDAQVNAVY